MTGPSFRGRIDVVDPTTRIGVICDPYGARFRFGKDDFAAETPLVVGQTVGFIVGADGRAGQIRPVASSAGVFDMGRVVRRTFWLLRRRWGLGVGASAVLVGASSAVQALGYAGMAGDLSTWMYWLGLIATQTGHYLLIGLMATVAIDDLRGGQKPAGEALPAWARMAPPLCVLAVVATLGISAAYLLVIVPGVILSLSWSVAGPVLMIERRRVIDSLGRSRDLASGHRWNILGLFVAYGGLWWGVRFAVRAVVHAFFGKHPGAQIACDAVVTTLGDVVVALGLSALYYELLTVKEGDEPDQLASVFD
jgi:hypothetical protein